SDIGDLSRHTALPAGSIGSAGAIHGEAHCGREELLAAAHDQNGPSCEDAASRPAAAVPTLYARCETDGSDCNEPRAGAPQWGAQPITGSVARLRCYADCASDRGRGTTGTASGRAGPNNEVTRRCE